MTKKHTRIILFIVSILAIVLSVLSTCICFFVNTEKTDENIFNDNIFKVVEIRVSNDNVSWGYGTGCFISLDGSILTNKHIVYDEKQSKIFDNIQIRLPAESEYVNAIVCKLADTDDLAILNASVKNKEYFSLAESVRDGMEIYTIGNPNGWGLSFVKGNVSSKLRKVVYNETSIDAIQTSLIVNEGNSGGPVFDKQGKLLGIISFRLKDKNGQVIQGVSFAVPLQNVKKFLNIL